MFLSCEAVDADGWWALEHAHCEVFWSLFWLKNDEIGDHFGNVDDVYLLNFEFAGYFDLGETVYVAADAREVCS